MYVPPAQGQPTMFINDRGLDFFHQHLAASLDGQFDSEFWSKLVLQLSQSEPSIRHAVSAVSISYQDIELCVRNSASYVKSSPDAQLEWNKAIKALSRRIETDPSSSLVPLVCCLLFTCVEMFRGNVDPAFLHIESGFNILASSRPSSDPGLKQEIRTKVPDRKAIEDYIVPMFTRLNVVCSLAGRITPSMQMLTFLEDRPHQDLNDSRLRLFEVSNASIQFIHDIQPRTYLFQINVEDFVRQAKITARLDAWRSELDDLLAQLKIAGKDVNQDALNLLLVHYKVIHIWARVCTSIEESATDSYFKDFEELVHCAASITKPETSTATPELLSFEFSITGPLYYAALKCRHPATRRRALELLRFAPRREGLWNSRYGYVTAKRIIELEEANVKGSEWPDEAARVHGLVLPDDTARIYAKGEVPFDPWKFVPSPTCPGILEIFLKTKPWGVLGEWHTIVEYVQV
jgi:hypothetical protein